MSIHLRLALWYSAVLGVTLVVFGLLLYFLMERQVIDSSDADIASRAHHIASTIRSETSVSPALEQVDLPPIDAFESPGIYVQVLRPNGQVVAHSDNLVGHQLPAGRLEFDAVHPDQGVFYTARVGNDQVRIYVHPVVIGGTLIGFIQVARSSGEAYTVLGQLQLSLVGIGAASLLLAGLIAWAIAGEALRPIANLTRTARAIATSRDFSRRLEDSGSRDELSELDVTFNEMLASLEDAYASQQRFVADASHELRTPLTTVRANLELLARQGEGLPPSERELLVRAALDEAGRMSRLVADLLSLARADAGQKLKMRTVELDRLLLEVFGEARAFARNVRLNIGALDEVSLQGDPDRLKQLVLILVDNAIRYTPAGGQITLSLRKDATWATVEVADTGIGISPEDLPQIFDRFYRADKARARDDRGTGLGLSIAKWILDQHGGRIAVSSKPGRGSSFIVQLPLTVSALAVSSQTVSFFLSLL